ncbi:hypothetical protein [Methanocalculus sp.]|uniref:hypothetical protein n=1 Tax=Methanocalculus sp. TaxID=2004547 RepID=UPI0026178050|nr:hypothetical protein [Methanocalculus sp.]MDG6250357.1 hypothetical protein [Methanocalculus sp.]
MEIQKITHKYFHYNPKLMNLKGFFIILSVLCISSITIAGCVSNSTNEPHLSDNVETYVSTPTPTPVPPPSIDTVFSKYYYSYLLMDEHGIWNLLSASSKEEQSKDQIYNEIFIFTHNVGVILYDYEVINTEINGDEAKMDVDIKYTLRGYKMTKSKEIPFVFEDGSWKINKFMVLS